MMFMIPSEERMVSSLSKESKESAKASKVLREFIILHRSQMLEAIRSSGIDLNTIEGIEVETLIGVSPGHSVGVKRFVGYAPNLGIIRKLYLYLGKDQLTTYLPRVQIGKRSIGITVHLRPQTF